MTTTTRRSRGRAPWPALLAATAFLAAGATAQAPGALVADPDPDAPLTPITSLRGFRAHEPFMAGETLEAINVTNGNMVLAVPLGQRYEVGPVLSYQLRVTHNSDVWDHARITCEGSSDPQLCNDVFEPVDMAVPNPNSNAGLGWELHFGELYQPSAPPGAHWAEMDTWPNRDADTVDGVTRWLYVSPDGASHTLHHLAGRPGVANGTRYAKDGSMLRMVPVAAGVMEVQHPDGVVSTFLRVDEWLGTNICGPGRASGCWRFDHMRDANGNYVRVDYAFEGVDEVWTITDSTLRQHRIVFSADRVSAGGGDASPNQLINGDGDELGDLRRIVKRVELAAFGGATATYTFQYTYPRMSRGCPSNTDTNGGIGFHPDNFQIRVPVLGSIGFPEGQGYAFETNQTSAAGCSLDNGKIASVLPPTQGKVTYTYGNWSFPTRCTYTNDPDAELDFQRRGIRTKSVYKVNAGSPESTWTYSSLLHGDPVISGPDCTRYDFRETIVDHPAAAGRFTRTRHYTNLFYGPLDPVPTTTIDEQQVTDSGLPYRKDIRVGSLGSARFLSEQTEDCAVGGACVRKRRKFVRYEMAYRNCVRTRLGLADDAECYRVDPILAAERTVFDDDGGRYIERQRIRTDGAGNIGLDILRDNFEGNRDVRTTTNFTTTGQIFTADPTTGYFDLGTPSTYLPGTAAPWILHRYDQVKLEGYDQDADPNNDPEYVTDYQFDAAGLPTCERRRVNPAGRGANDLITRWDRNAQGLVTREIHAGGDSGGQSTTLCSVNGTAAAGTRFDIVHTYQHLKLASSRIAGYPYRYRATIDRNTGLPSALYDVADARATLTFDALSRVTHIVPDSPSIATTRVYYFNDPLNFPRVDMRLQNANGVILQRAREWFDHRGRVFQEGTYTTTDGANTVEALVNRAWDARGNLTRENVRQPRGSVDNNWSTRYANFDAFGRPGQITRPDGTVETRTHQGDRVLSSTVAVRTSEAASTNVTTTTHFDLLGRDTRVVNPLFTLTKGYDPNDRVVALTRTQGTATQTRGFGWDNRGFLTYEDLPEVGASTVAAGRVTHRRDAFGNPRATFDGQRWRTYDYDTGGRKTAVREGSRLWQTWVWGATTSTDPGKGRIIQSTRFNYPNIDTWAFVEDYAYNVHGRVIQKALQLEHPNKTGNERYRARFVQSYTYDQTGLRTSVSYPTCVTTPQTGERFCNDPSDVQAPVHTVTSTYRYARRGAVTSSLGVSAAYTHHGNLALATAGYGNGTGTDFALGDGGLPRPERILTTRGNGTTVFDSGAFSYDGAGNIWAVGSDRYTYDGAGRLLSGTVKRAGATRRADYRFDAFDNLTGFRRDGSAVWQNITVDGKNRLTGIGVEDGITYDPAGNLVRKGRSLTNPFLLEERFLWDGLNMQTNRRVVDGLGNLVNNQEWIYLYGPGEYRVFVFDGRTGERHWKLRDLDGKPLRAYKALDWGPYQGPSSPGERWTFERDYVSGDDGMFATVGLGNIPRYFHRDHLGSTRVITDAAGNRVHEAAYYPYGEEITLFGTGDGTSKFTGHERDLHDKTDYMLGRTYYPDLRRFMSVDPARDGWNLYGYVGGDPIGYVDPTGRETFKVSGSFSGGLGLAIKGELALVFDDNGNVAIMKSEGVGPGIGADLSFNVGGGTYDTVFSMEGLAFEGDLTLAAGGGGVEQGSTGDIGFEVSAGPGLGVFGVGTETEILASGNVISETVTDFLSDILCLFCDGKVRKDETRGDDEELAVSE